MVPPTPSARTPAKNSSNSDGLPRRGGSPPRARIYGLTVVHLAMAIATASLAHLTERSFAWQETVFLGIVFGQASVLGICGSLRVVPRRIRLAVAFVGTAYLTVVSSAAAAGWSASSAAFLLAAVGCLLMVIFTTTIIAIILQHDFAADPAPAPVQFSIRQLLILIAVIAGLFTLVRIVQLPLPDTFEPAPALLHLAIIGCVGIVPAMLILVTRDAVLQLVGTVAAGAGIGLVLSACSNWEFADYWVNITTTQATTVLVTLFIIRYRTLVDRAAADH